MQKQKIYFLKTKSSIEMTDRKPSPDPDDKVYVVKKQFTPQIRIGKPSSFYVKLKEEDGLIARFENDKWIIGNYSELGLKLGVIHYLLREQKIKTTHKGWKKIRSDYKYYIQYKDGNVGTAIKDRNIVGVEKNIYSVHKILGQLVWDEVPKTSKLDEETYLFVEGYGPIIYGDIKQEFKNKTIFVLGDPVEFGYY